MHYLVEFESEEKSPFNSKFMVCEKYLGPLFIKYNNNSNYVLKTDSKLYGKLSSDKRKDSS